MAAKTPRANIEWNKIPPGACVEDRGKLYVAHMGKKQAVVFWGSQDAKQAQAALWVRSQDRCVGNLKRKLYPLPGLRGPRRARKKRR